MQKVIVRRGLCKVLGFAISVLGVSAALGQEKGLMGHGGTTTFFGGSPMANIPSALHSEAPSSDLQIPVAIGSAPPTHLDFFQSLDAFFDEDKNIFSLHDQYLQLLFPYETYNTFYFNTQDTYQYHDQSLQNELALRQQMAHELLNYLLAKGLPNFLATREETKELGAHYASAVGAAQAYTKLNIQSEDNSAKFSAGMNPFTQKVWVNWEKGTLLVEASKYLGQTNTSLISIKKNYKEFSLGTFYHPENQTIEPYYWEPLAPNLNYQVGLIIPAQGPDVLQNTSNYIRITAKF